MFIVNIFEYIQVFFSLVIARWPILSLHWGDLIRLDLPTGLRSKPAGAKFTLVREDTQISFERVATQGDLVYRQYCLLPAPWQLI